MSSLRHKNKYLDAPRSSQLAGVPDNTVRSIRLELDAGHTKLIDFCFLDERPQMQYVFWEYFRLIGQSVAPITRAKMVRAIREFTYFLEEYEQKNQLEFSATTDLDRNILLNYRIWLETRPSRNKSRNQQFDGEADKPASPPSLNSNSAASFYNDLVLVLNRLRRYRPEWFPLISNRIARVRIKQHKSASVEVLSMTDLKKILEVAATEIDRARERYVEIQSLLQKTKALPVVSLKLTRSSGYWLSKENAVHSLVREQGVMGPHVQKVAQAFDRLGTSITEVLSAYVPIGERSLLPVALQLSVQTGLNVSSLVTLTRDCIQDFSLPQYKRLIYDKARSRSRRAKSQLIPSSSANSATGRNESPLQLIEFLLKWTEPLIERAPSLLKNSLFIYRAEQGNLGKDRVKALSRYFGFACSLEKFLTDHPNLPKFALKDLRPAVATYLYLTTRDLFRVKRFLGHSSIKTTLIYIRGSMLATEHDLNMAEGIERMVSRLLPGMPSDEKRHERSLPILATVVDAVPTVGPESSEPLRLGQSDLLEIKKSGVMTLVARCRDPNAPPAFLNVPPGRSCTKIFKCLQCPNATVLEEDLPTVLHRLKKIWAERERLSLEGWQVLYGEAWVTLNQVVRLFSNTARERAEKELELRER